MPMPQVLASQSGFSLRYMVTQKQSFIASGNAFTSVVTKKKELIVDCRNLGQACRYIDGVLNVYDFLSDSFVRVLPYVFYFVLFVVKEEVVRLEIPPDNAKSAT